MNRLKSALSFVQPASLCSSRSSCEWPSVYYDFVHLAFEGTWGRTGQSAVRRRAGIHCRYFRSPKATDSVHRCSTVQTGRNSVARADLSAYLIAAIFKLFGLYSYSSNLIIRTFNLACSAFTCWPRNLRHRKPGHLARATAKRGSVGRGCSLPTAIFYLGMVEWVLGHICSRRLWMAILLAATLKLRGSDQMRWWVGYGALWSVGAMINPSLISVLPFVALWALWPLRTRALPAIKLASACACLWSLRWDSCPWAIRNYVVFHRFIPLRSNFGLELPWLGNNPDVPDSWTPWLHPTNSQGEAFKYAQMTEIPYMAEKQREALTFIRSHPGRDGWPGCCIVSRIPGWARFGLACRPVAYEATNAVIPEAGDCQPSASIRSFLCVEWVLSWPAVPFAIRT